MKAVESVNKGLNLIKVDLKLSGTADNVSIIKLRRGAAERCYNLLYNEDHCGTFFQGYLLPPDMTVMNNVIRPSAPCTGHFCKKDSGA